MQPASRIAPSHKSMMNVVDSAKRRSENGDSNIVPYEVIQSPMMWMPMPHANTPKYARQPGPPRHSFAHSHANPNDHSGNSTNEWVKPRWWMR